MIVVIRHGERADQSQIEYDMVEKYFDPHLTKVGADQAQVSGKFISQLITQHAKRFNIDVDQVEPVILSSPFLRCLMTSINICKNIKTIHKQTIFIQDEIGELMDEFDHNILPELKIRVDDRDQLNNKYLGLGELKIGPKYFTDARLIDSTWPENHQQIELRLKTFLKVFFEQVVQKEDFKKKLFICVTHQGVQKEFLEAIKIAPTTNLGYCSMIQILLPGAEQGLLDIEVPIRGDMAWKNE